MLKFLIFILCLHYTVNVSMMCTGKTPDGNNFSLIANSTLIELSIDSSSVITWTVFYSFYDGSMTGLIGGDGIAVKYDNQCGNYNNVIIITDFHSSDYTINAVYLDQCQEKLYSNENLIN